MLSLPVYTASQMKAKKCNSSRDASSKAIFLSVKCQSVIDVVTCSVLHRCSSFTHWYIKMDDTSSLPPAVQKCGQNTADTSAGDVIRRPRLRVVEVPSQSTPCNLTHIWAELCHDVVGYAVSPPVTWRRSIALSLDALEFNASCGELVMKCL